MTRRLLELDRVTLKARKRRLETGVFPEGNFLFKKDAKVSLPVLGNVKRTRALNLLFRWCGAFRIVPILLCRNVYPLSGWVCNFRIKGTKQSGERSCFPSHLPQGFCAEGSGEVGNSADP